LKLPGFVVTTEPHFIRDYRRVVAKFLASHPLDEAMALAVGGGDYRRAGEVEGEVLAELGLRPGQFIVDVGCGSGRLSTQLSQRYGAAIQYLGLDVVPELLSYARSKADPSYRFEVTAGLSIPISDASADFVAAFSVFTHLKHRETNAYFQEAERVLRPAARLVFTFLELPYHTKHLLYTLAVTMVGQRKVQNHFLSRSKIQRWAREIGFEVEALAPHSIGQSLAVLRKI
jgi:ubiquinone/menaquinone biosynthesis C-methylase UbiE